jgi:hypothetical protein
MTATQRKIVFKLCRAARVLGAKSDLIGLIGGWGETLRDRAVLDGLIKLNNVIARPALSASESRGIARSVRDPYRL